MAGVAGGGETRASTSSSGSNGTASGARDVNAIAPAPAAVRDHTIKRNARNDRESIERDGRVDRESSTERPEKSRSKRKQQTELEPNTVRPTNRRDRDRGLSPQVPTTREQDLQSVPDHIKQRFVQVGKKYHFPDGARAFTDHGSRLTSPSENTEVIKSMISIAQARGWSDVTLSGTERFRKEAWFAARVAGLEARGYSPTELEQGRLVRMLAREQAPRAPDSSAPLRAASVRTHSNTSRSQNEPAPAQTAPRERQRTLQVGRLVDHGAAPYLHDAQNGMSYFVRIETREGERDIWGVDLQRAIKGALTRPKIGDEIGVRTLRRDAVKVFRPEHDGEGRVIGEKAHETHRNAWVVEKREFFRDRVEAARLLRDSSVDRQQAVKQHPELLGTYLQLRAAELAAKTVQHPNDQKRFLASVRAALADSVARGEPLPPVPLKENKVQRAPAAREREAVPTR